MIKLIVFAGVAVLTLAACNRKPQHDQPATVAASHPVQKTYSPVDLLDAFKAVFGDAAPHKEATGGVIVLGDHSGEPEYKYYSPMELVDVAPSLVALLVKGVIPDTCHACFGDNSIFYLSHKDGKFELLGKWPKIAEGSGFGEAAEASIRRDLSDEPIVVFSKNYMAQGCSQTAVDLVKLTAIEPVVLLKGIALEVDNTGAGDWVKNKKRLKGHIKTINIEGRPSLKIDYTGTMSFNKTYPLTDISLTDEDKRLSCEGV